MTQAQATFTVNVKSSSSQPGVITITPSNAALPDETEGQPTSDQVAVVSVDANVVLPLNYTFSGQPAGVTFVETDNGDGTFTIKTSGTPSVGDATGSPYTIQLTVSDSAPVTAKASAKVRVIN